MSNLAPILTAFLVLFPALVALVLWVCRSDKARTFITVVGALVIACGSIFFAVELLPVCSASGAQYFAVDERLAEGITLVTLAIDVIISLYIIVRGIVCKRYLAPVLALCQLALILWIDLVAAHGVAVAHHLYVDNLSIIMVLVIGIIGSGICVYALGYMRDYQAHAEGKDRRPVFFALMFVFLSAMFGIVLSNALSWMLCAWEVTTVCSFALIGFTRTDEAIANSFRQINLNLVGGLAFAIALAWCAKVYGTAELDQFISLTLSYNAAGQVFITYLPLMLLALAGFTKAAQMPFQSWLLGAMVAPTPTSALLHSSTMVKAGVFLIIKLAPCLGANLPGYLVMFVGGVTFVLCAMTAISQSNAKRVLAYSTISNLGLIVMCAGLGTDAAVWAAIFLLVFHAAAKSLLFLCVGTAEHHVGSRDIESFDQLFERMPMLARLMAVGILGMFIAPFGMLVSKWAALAAVANSSNVVLILLLVFGSAVTFMFWAKWLGKVLAVANSGAADLEETVHRSEWASMGLMTVLTVGCCLAFPLISTGIVVPYLEGVFGSVSLAISNGDLWIMAVIALVVAVVMLGFSGKTKKRVVPVYMAGAGIDLDQRTYLDSFGAEVAATQRNWYMDDLFGEKRVIPIGLAVSLTLLAGFFGYQLQQAQANQEVIGVYASVNSGGDYEESSWAAAGIEKENYDVCYHYFAQDYLQNYESYVGYGYTTFDAYMDDVLAQMQSQLDTYASEYASYYGIEDLNDFAAAYAANLTDADTGTEGEGE